MAISNDMQKHATQSGLDHDEQLWGEWRNLEEDSDYKVKNLYVRPGHRMSLRYHNHRAEHWVVVRGRARVVLGQQTLQLDLMRSIHVPKGMNHRIEHCGPAYS